MSESIPGIELRHVANIRPANYAELQSQPNVDSRADGGFINPENARPRDRRMKWDAEADRQLLIFGFGREIRSNEYQILADRYPTKPTVKAIQERITKLRVETRRALKETGIFDPDRMAQPPPNGGAPARGPATPGQGTFSPAPAFAKKKPRLCSSAPESKDAAVPPGADTPTSSSPPPQSQPAQMGRQELPSRELPSASPHPPPPPAWGTRLPPGAPVATMYGPPMGSLQAMGSQMGMPPMGKPSFRPYGAIPPSVWAGMGMGMGPYRQQQQQQLPAFTPVAYTPTLLSQQPTGAGTNSPVPSMGDSAEGEQENPLARSERELKEKKAKREAVSEKSRSMLTSEILY